MAVNAMQTGGEASGRRPGLNFPGANLCSPGHLLLIPGTYRYQYCGQETGPVPFTCQSSAYLQRGTQMYTVHIHREYDRGLCGTFIHINHLARSGRVNITVPNHTASILTVRYQYLLLDLLHASNDNLIILIEAL